MRIDYMMTRTLLLLFCFSANTCFSQHQPVHINAHAHNDYEHDRPLMSALQNGFISVEADVHLQDGKLLVSHNHPDKNSSSLEKLYLEPLDSLLVLNSGVYKDSKTTFYLMIDIKTEAESTYQAIKQQLATYPSLRCLVNNCPVKIFISGNRPIATIMKDHSGVALDGRPDDVGKGYSSEMMPVISDNFKNWSDWNGKSKPSSNELARIKSLASRVHGEGKKLRLWAIPDNEMAWAVLLDAGVDFINTDHLEDVGRFLSLRGL